MPNYMDAVDIAAMAEEEAKKVGISPELYKQVILKGENYGADSVDLDAVSPKGAKGPAQVIDATWQGLIKNGKIPKDADRADVRTNFRAGALVLKEQLAMAGGNDAAAVAGYNGGNEANRAVQRGELPAAEETRKYLERLGLSPQKPWLDGSNSGETFTGGDDEVAPTASVTPAGKDTKGLTPSRITSKTTPEQRAGEDAALAAHIQTQKELTKKMQDALLGSAGSTDIAATATLTSGNAAADATTIKGNIEIAKLLQQQQINNVMHVSVRDPDSVIVAAQQQRKEAQIKMDALRPVIEEEDKVAVWDDPLRWIANQFTLPNLKREYNNAAKKEATMVSRMSTTQQLAEAQQRVDPANVVEDIGRHAAAQATQLSYHALAEASKLKAESANYTARAIQQDIILNDRSWDQTVSLARQHQESLSYARQIAADDKLTAAEKHQQGVADAISLKLNTIGMPSIDVPTLKSLGPQRAGRLIDWAQLPTLGNGPGESMAAIREFGSEQAMDQKNPVLFKFINQLATSQTFKDLKAEKASDAKFNSLPAEQQRELLVQEVYHKQREELETKKGDNSKLSGSNPYKLMHLNSAMIPELQGNEFAEGIAVIRDSSPDKKTVTDKDMMLSLLGKVQADPKNAGFYASELSEYYRKAAENQWIKSGAMITGYPRFHKYGVSDPSNTNKVVDAFNPLELEAWATRRMTAKLAGEVSADNIWGSSMGLSR